jgi:esterase/lipase superfamily enzyme
MVALLQMNERHLRWYSPWLSREFEMLAFGNGGGLPLIIFPTSFGRYYQNKDFGVVGSVSAFVDAGKVTVYCPDANDLESFYNKSIHPADRMRTHNAYENVIVQDVFDFARRECRLPSSRSLRSQSRRLSRGQHCFSSSGRRQSSRQLERIVRYQLVLRRLSRRQHLL